MTAQVMSSFGAEAHISEAQISIAPGGYKATYYVVEPDFSSAAFPLVAVALREGTVNVPSLALAEMQGDAEILEILKKMGCAVSKKNSDIQVSRSDERLHGIEIDMSDCSDLVPAVAVGMLFADSDSRITGVGFIRRKESDRLGDLASELQKIGAEIEVEEDGLVIHPLREMRPASLRTHHDHRLAMAFSLLALSVEGVEVEDPAVVSKSWPGFFADMGAILGASGSQH
jgi:3-phosphoshikimate 1-carboxyvinyltransferase